MCWIVFTATSTGLNCPNKIALNISPKKPMEHIKEYAHIHHSYLLQSSAFQLVTRERYEQPHLYSPVQMLISFICIEIIKNYLLYNNYRSFLL